MVDELSDDGFDLDESSDDDSAVRNPARREGPDDPARREDLNVDIEEKSRKTVSCMWDTFMSQRRRVPLHKVTTKALPLLYTTIANDTFCVSGEDFSRVSRVKPSKSVR